MSGRHYDKERRRQEKIAKKEQFMTVGRGMHSSTSQLKLSRFFRKIHPRHPFTDPGTPQTPPKQPINAPPIPQKPLMLS